MTAPPPGVYLFFGDDEFAQAEAVVQMRRKLGDAAAADLNLSRFSGASLDLEELTQACHTLPFLAPRRIVTVASAHELTRHPNWDERLTAIAQTAPTTTALILLEEFDFNEVRRRAKKGRASPDELHRAHSPLGAWAAGISDRVLRKPFERPRGAAFLRWLQDRAARLEGALDDDAAAALAEMVDGDPRLADRELSKLLDYLQRERPISRADVQRLTPFHAHSDVFAMVDSLGSRDARGAISHLHALLQDNDPQYALHMIARQVRLLIQAGEALDVRDELSGAFARLPPFVQAKLRAQAAHFSLPELDALHRHLLDLDLSVKSSRIDLATGLDALIAEWVHPSAPPGVRAPAR
ncbi:MAG TPA: DNA polymerase III subunit delta [Anaerolineales bacterium]